MVVGRVQLKWVVTHTPTSPDNGESSKMRMSRCDPTSEPSKVEVARFELIVWFWEA
jgi:hypothetical protein